MKPKCLFSYSRTVGSAPSTVTLTYTGEPEGSAEAWLGGKPSGRLSLYWTKKSKSLVCSYTQILTGIFSFVRWATSHTGAVCKHRHRTFHSCNLSPSHTLYWYPFLASLNRSSAESWCCCQGFLSPVSKSTAFSLGRGGQSTGCLFSVPGLDSLYCTLPLWLLSKCQLGVWQNCNISIFHLISPWCYGAGKIPPCRCRRVQMLKCVCVVVFMACFFNSSPMFLFFEGLICSVFPVFTIYSGWLWRRVY